MCKSANAHKANTLMYTPVTPTQSRNTARLSKATFVIPSFTAQPPSLPRVTTVLTFNTISQLVVCTSQSFEIKVS